MNKTFMAVVLVLIGTFLVIRAATHCDGNLAMQLEKSSLGLLN